MAAFSEQELSTPEEVEEEGCGITLYDVGRAMMIWASMNYEANRSVATCALAFNTTPELVRRAVTDQAWMLLVPEDEADPEKQLIELDGL